ncbi:hypothetical protein ACFSKL_09255 [Belliella marina]|uniref:Uncharacterized protein n=1 Tax=Belliella marina TaxID=1644146 RepID=A0ABW4VN75_9BACT
MRKLGLLDPLAIGRACVFVYTIGLFLNLQTGSVLGSVLFMDYALPIDQVKHIEKVCGFIFLILGFLSLVPKLWFAMLPIALGAFGFGYLAQDFGGNFFSMWSLAGHAPRYLLPIGLVFLSFDRTKATGGVALRMGLALVFFIHGVESWLGHPYFAEYILNSFDVLGLSLKEDQALLMMKIIGGVDVLVATLILAYPVKYVYMWALFWVLVTFAVRFLSFGWLMHKEVLVRWPNIALPVVLLLLVIMKEKKASGELSPTVAQEG